MERKPDFNRLKKVLLREGEPDVLPFYELFADAEVIREITGKPAGIEATVEFQFKMGYDYVPAGISFGYPKRSSEVEDTAALSRGRRNFTNDNHGMIENRKDFDAYPWPEITDGIGASADEGIRLLPDGMKMLVNMPAGILENVMWLMGYIPFSYAIHDDAELIGNMFERIGTDFTAVLEKFLSETRLDKIGGIVVGDDMGFNHSTMVSPEFMRKYVFPRQKKLAEITHRYELPFILHSCGNLEGIMEDLIEYVKIDAKHSYEDKIQPVAEAKKLYGSRIAILGGVDMHFISVKTAEEVKNYTAEVIGQCAPGGGYALGTGNTMANYVPLENYYAMLEAGREWKY